MKTQRKTPPKKSTRAEKSVRSSADSSLKSSTIYKDFSVWTSQKIPSWHPVKKMRYVFFRMINGQTAIDAIAEIHWNASEFWHLVDKNHLGPFALEYKRAKKLQGRAFGDRVVIIADGRDDTSRHSVRKLRLLIKKAMRRASKQKSSLGAKAILDGLLSQIDVNEHRIIARNKLQMDAAKWIAKTSAPNEYSETSKVAVGGSSAGEGDDAQKPVLIQFVGPNGKVVPI